MTLWDLHPPFAVVRMTMTGNPIVDLPSDMLPG
jgi:hypothetical protein